MRFAYPFLLLLFPVLLLAGWALHRYSRKLARQRLSQFSPAGRLETILRTLDPIAKRWKTVLFAAGLLLVVLSLARPLLGPKQTGADQKGAEFYFILDISNSMLVRDVEPDRLEAVKLSLAEWLKTRHGDRIGLIVVAGDAFVQAPLTSDYVALREVLMQSNPSALSVGGTNLPAAIVTATKALRVSEQRTKVVVIISDGENLEGDAVAAVQQARSEMDRQITFHTIGVGTAGGGKVPVYRKGQKIDYKVPAQFNVRDEYGVLVNSRLDERKLRSIAQAGGGRYLAFDPAGDTWNALYTQVILPLAKKVDKLDLKDYMDLFQFPLALAVLLLAWEIALSDRRKNPPRPRSIVNLPEPGHAPAAATMKSTSPTNTTTAAPKSTRARAFTLSVILACIAGTSFAQTEILTIEQAEQMVRDGKGKEAAASLWAIAQKNPEDHYALYNYAIAAYATGQFLEASQAFAEVSGSSDERLNSLALTQLGNAQYRLGEGLKKVGNNEGTILAWERSVEYYRHAIEQKSLKDTKHNLEIVAGRLEETMLSHAKQQLSIAKTNIPLNRRIAVLEQAVTTLEKTTELNPKNPEAKELLTDAKKQYVAALTDLAREKRKQSETALAQYKKSVEKDANKPDRQARGDAQTARQVASETYQTALAIDPENKPLEKEFAEFKKEYADAELNEAQEHVADAEKEGSNSEAAKMDKQQDQLMEALKHIENALAFDESNERGAKMKQDVLKKLEESYAKEGDLYQEQGDAKAAKKPSSTRDYSAAVANYQQALELNPENAPVKAKLEEVESKLAKAFVEAGKEATAQAEALAAKQAAKPAAAGENGEPPKPPSAASLQEQIGQMEVATQSFSQSEALAPGENGAAELEKQASEKLGELRNQLDGALAQEAQAAEGEEGDPKPPGTESPQFANGPDKPILSFADIRGNTEKEGQFVDKSKKVFIKNW